MQQEYFFSSADWVGSKERSETSFSVLRGHFYAKNIKDVSLNILGLGFFKCYINGKCINPDTFLPLSSDYENSCDPEGEVLSGHRIYVPQFDITPFVQEGDNVIAVHFGGGWYCHSNRVFGLPKVIWRISVQSEDGVSEFVSNENCRIRTGLITDYNFTKYETQNFLEWEDCFAFDFDDSLWDNAVLTEELKTEYCSTDCPADKLVAQLPVKEIGNGVYDCSQNTTGYPVLEINAEEGQSVTVYFSEELLSDGKLDMTHSHSQKFSVVSDGTVRIVQPQFTWFGFRYFEIEGEAKPLCVKVVYADVRVSSSFESDNETLNWIYKTFIHTMLCNMHTGHPSDCPHIERRGYTGDGQLTCNAVLSVLDARKFYEKWLQDIADSQDVLTGHIQYTAPYIHSGGGPGGWGSAIVEVPYQLYKHYGDTQVLEKYYDNMRRYIDYLEEHSEFGLVTSDKEGDWCLGDWCGPVILYPEKDITSHNQQVVLPAAFVNTYFMVKSLQKMCEIARIINKEEDISEYEEKIKLRKAAITAAYFNAFDDNFIMNIQGANAFAVDLGLGNEHTYRNMVSYYQKIGCYDTGIFATDILTRVLFEKGDWNLATLLLTHNGKQGYENWRKNGATTFHEYWDSFRSRSHNHPMFGATVAYIFEYLLGIRQEEGSAGYSSLLIAPQAVSQFKKMSGSITIPTGVVCVEYQHTADGVNFVIDIPEKTKAVFKYAQKSFCLSAGENRICVPQEENA